MTDAVATVVGGVVAVMITCIFCLPITVRVKSDKFRIRVGLCNASMSPSVS